MRLIIGIAAMCLIGCKSEARREIASAITADDAGLTQITDASEEGPIDAPQMADLTARQVSIPPRLEPVPASPVDPGSDSVEAKIARWSKGASAVEVATVGPMTSRAVPDAPGIVTDVILLPHHLLRGPSATAVTQWGGTVGTDAVFSASDPLIRIGRTYLFFVFPSEPHGPRLRTAVPASVEGTVVIDGASVTRQRIQSIVNSEAAQ